MEWRNLLSSINHSNSTFSSSSIFVYAVIPTEGVAEMEESLTTSEGRINSAFCILNSAFGEATVPYHEFRRNSHIFNKTVSAFTETVFSTIIHFSVLSLKLLRSHPCFSTANDSHATAVHRCKRSEARMVNGDRKVFIKKASLSACFCSYPAFLNISAASKVTK